MEITDLLHQPNIYEIIHDEVKCFDFAINLLFILKKVRAGYLLQYSDSFMYTNGEFITSTPEFTRSLYAAESVYEVWKLVEKNRKRVRLAYEMSRLISLIEYLQIPCFITRQGLLLLNLNHPDISDNLRNFLERGRRTNANSIDMNPEELNRQHTNLKGMDDEHEDKLLSIALHFICPFCIDNPTQYYCELVHKQTNQKLNLLGFVCCDINKRSEINEFMQKIYTTLQNASSLLNVYYFVYFDGKREIIL
uniref:Uncharacterized protein n=1 Tax=viral metagenome TaxID=1070528 RepID=A0A6C0CRR0_9ZZZZ